MNGGTTDHVGTSKFSINPRIGPLTAIRGKTPIHPLLSGSPAIDEGQSFGATYDQTGRRREHKTSRTNPVSSGDFSDIGAIEDYGRGS